MFKSPAPFYVTLVTLYWSLIVVSCYIQLIIVHDSDKDDGDFMGLTRQGVEDVQILPLNGIKKLCPRGWWLLYNETRFENFWKPVGSNGQCKTEDFSGVKSFRRIGAKNNDDDTLSLYEKVNYVGVETTITARVRGDIKGPIKSLGRTGSSDWTLYEEPDFDNNPSGKFYCLRGSSTKFSFTRDISSSYNLTKIGSVAKGCK